MFSALKKLVGSEQAPGRDKNIPAGLQSMNQALQRRFAKGVQYNSECDPAVERPGAWRERWAGACGAGPGGAPGLTPRGKHPGGTQGWDGRRRPPGSGSFLRDPA